MESSEKPVIVIGAGLSGLCAARHLVENNVAVIVLEAKDRVGGRTYTEWDKSTYGCVDLGGSWVKTTQNYILRLVKEFGIETYPNNMDFSFVYSSRGKRCVYTTTWPSFWWRNPLAGFDLRYVINKIDQLIEEIPLNHPWDAPRAKEWDSKTMADFINEYCWTKDAAEFMESLINALVTSQPCQISMLWFLAHIKHCGSIMTAFALDEERRLVGGTHAISLKLADIIGKHRILLGKPVIHVEQRDDSVTVFTKDGGKFEGSYIIQAMPLPMHLRITYDPPLSPIRRQLIQRASMGLAVKVIMWFRNAYWIKEGFNGLASTGNELINLAIPDLSDKIPFPSITCFITGEQAAYVVQMEPEERKEAIINSFLRLHGCTEVEKPIYYREHAWIEEPYIGGCYSVTYPPGVMSLFGHVIRQPFKRTYFAGTETATEWPGYMNGAVQAGERAAKQVLCTMGQISEAEIWAKEPDHPCDTEKPPEITFLEKYPPSVPQVIIFYSIIMISGIVGIGYFTSKKCTNYVFNKLFNIFML